MFGAAGAHPVSQLKMTRDQGRPLGVQAWLWLLVGTFTSNAVFERNTVGAGVLRYRGVLCGHVSGHRFAGFLWRRG
jgi:hypothetical protein